MSESRECFQSRPAVVTPLSRPFRRRAFGVSPTRMSSRIARASSASAIDVPPVLGMWTKT
jgi:hypothetical protein